MLNRAEIVNARAADQAVRTWAMISSKRFAELASRVARTPSTFSGEKDTVFTTAVGCERVG